VLEHLRKIHLEICHGHLPTNIIPTETSDNPDMQDRDISSQLGMDRAKKHHVWKTEQDLNWNTKSPVFQCHKFNHSPNWQECISKNNFFPGRMTPSEWMSYVRPVRNTPVADYSTLWWENGSHHYKATHLSGYVTGLGLARLCITPWTRLKKLRWTASATTIQTDLTNHHFISFLLICFVSSF